MLPLALLGPLSGVFVDRWPLKPTLVGSDLIGPGSWHCLFSSSLWHIYIILRAQLRVEFLRSRAVGDDPQPRAA